MSTPESQSHSATLPPARLVTTGHDAAGTSIFTGDTTLAPFHPFGPAGSGFTNFHAAPALPTSNTVAPADLSQTLPRVPPAGAYFGVVDFPAGGAAPLHRTLSVDYACVVAGEIVLRLDGGEERTVRAGEFILQRGANHEWINRTGGVTRVLFVMVGAEPIELADGRVLEETVFKK